jgi:hypothetical protein
MKTNARNSAIIGGKSAEVLGSHIIVNAVARQLFVHGSHIRIAQLVRAAKCLLAMAQDDHRSRSRSPEREHKRRRRHSPSPRPSSAPLPLNARELTRRDLRKYRPMFALYLDIQKHIDIDDLDESEVKGRWKSFVNKWYASHKSPTK